MSIQSEIDRLSGIKADLKAALAEKGQSVGDVFSTYPAAVRAIETGGGTCTGSMQFAPKGGVRYIYICSDGTGKVSDTTITDEVMAGSLLVVCFQKDLGFVTASGGIHFVGSITYSGSLSDSGEVYFITDDFYLS